VVLKVFPAGVKEMEKEVRVYYKFVGDTFVLLTVKARYGKIFLREEVRESENRI
jgi:hypothetical protein